MMMRNYVAFIMAAGVLLLALLLLVKIITNKMYHEVRPGKVVEQTTLLQAEKYSQIKSKKLLGNAGYIEVLDENAKVIYTDEPDKVNTYTTEDLKYIPEVTPEKGYFIDHVKGEDGKTETIITQYSYNIEANDTNSSVTGYAILDENKKILLTNINFGTNSLTEREIEYLYGDAPDDTYLQQYTFTTNQGETRHLLIHTTNSSDKLVKVINGVYIIWRPLFVVGVVVLMILFVFLMNRQIKRPLKILKTAMYDFSEGKRDKRVIYSGPEEFMQIFDTFNQMSEKLEEGEKNQKRLEQEKRKMLADISHDLKTPITVIQGYSKAICDGLVLEKKQYHYLNIIYQKASVLSELITSFYEYSRLEHPQFQIIKEERDICEFLREYVADKYEEMEMLGYKLEVELPEKKILFSFDPLHLQRVFENILINSVKHNPKGTTLYIGLYHKKNDIVIQMGDNGVGIPEQIRQTIFEPFVVGDDSRSTRQGTGLGLTIAQKIIEAHDGTISLMESNVKNVRTMFEIRFSG